MRSEGYGTWSVCVLESYLLTVAKSAVFCAYSVRVIMYTRACTRVRMGHGPGMNYIVSGYW